MQIHSCGLIGFLFFLLTKLLDANKISTKNNFIKLRATNGQLVGEYFECCVNFANMDPDDVKILCKNGRVLKSHVKVLSAASPILKQMCLFSREIGLTNYDVVSVQGLLEFIQTGMTRSVPGVVEIELAERLGIDLGWSENVIVLPDEILIRIFTFLPTSILLSTVSQVCKKFNKLAQDPRSNVAVELTGRIGASHIPKLERFLMGANRDNTIKLFHSAGKIS